MVRNKYILLCAYVFVSLFSNAFAQSRDSLRAVSGAVDMVEEIRSLQIGDRIPDSLLLTPMDVYDINTKDTIHMRLADYTGKLIIVDYWASWCTSCLISFQKTIRLRDKYKNSLEILYVQSRQDDADKGISKLIDLESAPDQFVLSNTFLNDLFPYKFLPHYVWFSPKGDLLAVTGDTMLSEENIERVLQNIKSR